MPRRLAFLCVLPLCVLPLSFGAGSICWGQVGTDAQSNITRTDRFEVDGLHLGGKVAFESEQYKQYQCNPSGYIGLTWCHRQVTEPTWRGAVTNANTILHSSDGTAVYVNRYVDPAFDIDSAEARKAIDLLSVRFHERAREYNLQPQQGLPNAVIAVWGQLQLEPINSTETQIVASGGSLHKGILVGFLGDLRQSARLGVPIFQLSGGPGYLWCASFNQNRRGVLRFLTIDPSLVAMPPNPPPGPSPPIQQPPAVAIQPEVLRPTQSPSPQSPREAAQTPAPTQPAPTTPYPSSHIENPPLNDGKTLSVDMLSKDQSVRDSLFNALKAGAAGYRFDYFVITLPPGTIPGVNVPIPVSHVRYNETVFFEVDKYTLEQGAESAVSDFAKTVKEDKALRSILVVGHTDSTGTDEYNVDLSKKRATTVATALIGYNINGGYLGIVPMGRAQPLRSNSTPEGRALNRRVEFFISDIPEAAKAAVELVPVNPCDRAKPDAASGSDCSSGPKEIDVLGPTGDGKPVATLEIGRAAIPSECELSGCAYTPLPDSESDGRSPPGEIQ
jgi:outer membrane protein OmpA-like peptidoglycan-associated protein